MPSLIKVDEELQSEITTHGLNRDFPSKAVIFLVFNPSCNIPQFELSIKLHETIFSLPSCRRELRIFFVILSNIIGFQVLGGKNIIPDKMFLKCDRINDAI